MKRQYGFILVLLFTNLCLAGGQVLDSVSSIDQDRQQPNDQVSLDVNNSNNSQVTDVDALADEADVAVTDAPGSTVQVPTGTPAVQLVDAFVISCLERLPNSNEWVLVDSVPSITVHLSSMKYAKHGSQYTSYCKNQGLRAKRDIEKVAPPSTNMMVQAYQAQEHATVAVD
ncbi:hypothetical protein N9N67_11745 [Bacteriovoracaceae bacterium]|nr:hypothetical protein [Bacteriovoracaceae bacterium]